MEGDDFVEDGASSGRADDDAELARHDRDRPSRQRQDESTSDTVPSTTTASPTNGSPSTQGCLSSPSSSTPTSPANRTSDDDDDDDVSSGRSTSASLVQPRLNGDDGGRDDKSDAKAFNFSSYESRLTYGNVSTAIVNGQGQDDYHYPTLTEKESPTYDLSEGDRLAIVFNHRQYFEGSMPERQGTSKDCEKIEDTFNGLGFKVHILDDPSYEKIDEKIKDLQRRQNLACLVLFILTHGEENGVLHSFDKPYRLERHIIDELTPNKCPSLAGRPKMIFVQACQGNMTDPGAEVRTRSRHTSTDGGGGCYRIPHYADFLVFQAAYHGHYSFRSKSGSWLVQTLCHYLKHGQESDSIHDVLLNVKRAVADKVSNVASDPRLDQKMQIPLVQDTLIRKVYLKSGVSIMKSEMTRATEEVETDRIAEPIKTTTDRKQGVDRLVRGDQKAKDKCNLM